ncbi:flagellar assembly peptidoglycan hydrolase FlgJ [Neptuniibacter sp. CAU 1671]|uniref:flagellar assembly peptidoglycan hydrolase FlgJ n=1 Tax=Neptuniibacter sp. CAU 1671 TaxID=3032593 RepID=UPI0023DA2F8E|nr:flagellar assembly peptidoglycan hydrolase FlgJ [Neptuniibacter sp. CAU 1671]MDF2181825.1 flagellar assembly peptidoglycan hydrolase FlgJ [Neptuniibacter sp. CAU 1671]
MVKPTSGQSTQLYTDLAELQKLKSKALTDKQEGLRLAAEQFEQLFMNMLLRSMREANAAFGEGNFMNSSQTEFYQGMFDNQLALEISSAKGKGIGLADVLVRQLSQAPQSPEKAKSSGEMELNLESRQLNTAMDRAAAMAAEILLQQGQKTERPPGVKPDVDLVATTVMPAESSKPQRFDSPEAFVETLMPMAQEVAAELGVDPRLLLAQSALETGWGRFIIGGENQSSFNLFNIKAGRSWQGDTAQVSTLEYRDGVPVREQAQFRRYAGYEESFRDYVQFLKNSPRYQLALESAADPYAYIERLQEAGYATDPAYAEKVKSIFEGEVLAGQQTPPPKEG